MTLRLRIEHGQDAGTTWRLPKPGVYTIGRQPTNSMRVLDMKVSKEHCEIRIVQQGERMRAALHDSGSTTGCQLNGQPVPKGKNIAINPGDELRIGLTILRVLSDGEADADVEPIAGRAVTQASVEGSQRGGDQGKTKQTLPADALVGKELSGYTIERKIGQGGMGGVYLAEQTSLQRKVALKVLNETFAADSAFVDQFVNEARAAGALNHPNVVQVYDVGSAQGHYFFSMEVMPGGSIEDKIKEGPISWEVGLNWFLDAANALIFAKKREILHRDVKPDNLMIAEDESAKLCDLGLAKKSEVGDLMDQGIIGTPHFISPEAIRRKADIDHRTDLYSLGCSFYRIFTGKNPYPGTSVKEILLGHLNKPIPRINDSNRNVPRELDEVVYQLMRKEPDDRLQTPEELLRELDKIRTKYNLEAHGIKPGSKKPLVIGLVAAVLAIGGAIWFVSTREDTVVERTKTPEEIAQELRDKRIRAEAPLKDYVVDAERRFSELNTEYLKGEIDEEDNWKKPIFPRIAREAKTSAEGWTAKLATWAKEKAKFKDPVILGFYETYPAALQGHIDSTTKLAQRIEKEIGDAKRFETRRKEGTITARKELEAAVAAYAQEVKKAFEDGDYLQLERLLRSDKLDEIVKTALAKTVGPYKLLKEKNVTPVLDKHIPGDKEGKNRGMQLLGRAERLIASGANEALSKARKALEGEPTFSTFKAALDHLDEWLGKVPNALDPEGAPTITRAWGRAKDAVERRRLEIENQLSTFELGLLMADRETYFRFLVDIWAPRVGLLRRYEFGVALEKAKKLTAELKHGKYQNLARTWPTPLAALDTVFKDVVAGFPDGWTEKHTYLPDRRGKLKKETIKEIDAKSVRIGKDTFTFEQLGASGLIDKLFFVEGKPRLTSCTPTHRVGLGMLAELAGDYELAMKQYMAAKGGADAELTQAIDERLKHAAAERQAAEKYLAIVRFLEQAEAWAKATEQRLAENNAKPGTLSDEERALIESEEGPRYEKDLQSFQGMRTELMQDAKLAGTTWGSALRDRVHPDVKYAGERWPVIKPLKPRKPDVPHKKGDAKK